MLGERLRQFENLKGGLAKKRGGGGGGGDTPIHPVLNDLLALIFVFLSSNYEFIEFGF